jgi:protein pelota
MKEFHASWVVQLQERVPEPIGLLPTEPDDLWQLYFNLITPGDIVMGDTTRRQVGESGETISRAHCMLAVRVEDVSYSSDTNEVRCKGVIVVESTDAPLGAYHSIVLRLDKPFALGKPLGWDTIARRHLDEMLRGDADGSLVAVVMQEGLANICLITAARTVVKRRLERGIASKRNEYQAAERIAADTRAFYDLTLDALRQEIDFNIYRDRPVLLASPGFVAANFRAHILKKSVEGEGTNKQLANLARNAHVVHCSTGHVHALNAILQTPDVRKLIHGMKSAKEGQYLDLFRKTLKQDEMKAWYGISDVVRLVNQGHVGAGSTLMVSNSLFRSPEVETRRKYTAMVQRVENAGGEIVIFSGAHEAAQGLAALGDIAVILPYPLYELEDEQEEAAKAAKEDEKELGLEHMIV